MYLVEYFKTDGKTIILQINDNDSLVNEVTSLVGMIVAGKVISFNVERIGD